MLKWRYQADEDDRSAQVLRIRRAGIDSQRKAIAKATFLKKFKDLKETVTFQAKCIDQLMIDKTNSVRLLENVMSEFSVLDKEINMAEEEIAFQRQVNKDLREEVSEWKTECANLRLCADLLQRDVTRVKPATRLPASCDCAGDNLILPLEATDIIISGHLPDKSRRLSQDATTQNMENESRLEVHASVNGNHGNTVPVHGPNSCPTQIFLASDFKRRSKRRKRQTIRSSRKQCHDVSMNSSSTTGCFQRFRWRLRKQKVSSLP